MITFDLQCNQGHSFEGWFRDGESFRDQHERNLLECPVCGSHSVKKVPSAVSFRTVSRFADGGNSEIDLLKVIQKISSVVEKNTKDVGADFAEEALKIHYGVIEPRNIRGVASEQEEKMLKDEGVSFFKVPFLVKKTTEGH